MGIINLPWKKIWGYFWKIIVGTSVLVGLIIGIIELVKNWNIVSNWLRTVGNFFLKIFAPLSNSIVRDVILFLLIVGIIVWLYLKGKKAKNIPPAEKSKKREKWKFEWTENHSLILIEIADEGDSGEHTGNLLGLLQLENPKTRFLDLQVIIDELESAGLIEEVDILGEDVKLYAALKKGRKIAKKILDKKRSIKKNNLM